MNSLRASWLAAALALIVLPGHAAMPTAQAAAAAWPDVQWVSDSALEGDYDCSGRMTSVILGRAKKQTELAVFLPGAAGPERLSYPEHLLDPTSAILSVEALEFSKQDFQFDNGRDLPPGLEPSMHCEGLMLTDDKGHVVHIYWNRRLAGFDDWLG